MIKAAVAGLNWGRVHISAYRELGCQVVALAGRDLEKCRQIANEYGIPESCGSVADLARSDADLISIAVPAADHFAALMQATDRFQFIVCEKPVLGFGGTAEQYAQLSGRIFFNYAYPFLEDMEIFCQKLRGIRDLREILIECRYHLELNRKFTPEEFFYETVSHPVSLVVHGLPGFVSAERTADDTITARTSSGTAVRIVCREDQSISGIRHRITATGEDELQLSGAYVTGSNWHYQPLLYNQAPISGEHYPAADPWYTANKNSLGNLVRYFSGEQSLEETLQKGAFSLEKAMIVENILGSLKEPWRDKQFSHKEESKSGSYFFTVP